MKRIFIDDESDKGNAKAWKKNNKNLNLYQVKDHCPFGTLEQFIRNN